VRRDLRGRGEPSPAPVLTFVEPPAVGIVVPCDWSAPVLGTNLSLYAWRSVSACHVIDASSNPACFDSFGGAPPAVVVGPASTVMTGAVVSRVIVSVATDDVLPTSSRSRTLIVLTPSPAVTVIARVP
jgi:hypothetical protein